MIQRDNSKFKTAQSCAAAPTSPVVLERKGKFAGTCTCHQDLQSAFPLSDCRHAFLLLDSNLTFVYSVSGSCQCSCARFANLIALGAKCNSLNWMSKHCLAQVTNMAADHCGTKYDCSKVSKTICQLLRKTQVNRHNNICCSHLRWPSL